MHPSKYTIHSVPTSPLPNSRTCPLLAKPTHTPEQSAPPPPLPHLASTGLLPISGHLPGRFLSVEHTDMVFATGFSVQRLQVYPSRSSGASASLLFRGESSRVWTHHCVHPFLSWWASGLFLPFGDRESCCSDTHVPVSCGDLFFTFS